MQNYRKIIGLMFVAIHCVLPLVVVGAEPIVSVSSSVSIDDSEVASHANSIEGSLSSPFLETEADSADLGLSGENIRATNSSPYTSLPAGMCEVVGGILSNFCKDYPNDPSCQF